MNSLQALNTGCGSTGFHVYFRVVLSLGFVMKCPHFFLLNGIVYSVTFSISTTLSGVDATGFIVNCLSIKRD